MVREVRSAGKIREQMSVTLACMMQEMASMAGLDDEAECAVRRLRLHLTWFQGQFAPLRVAEVAEAEAMRRSLRRAGDFSLDEEVGV
jgi:hypothetical protein